MQVMDREGEHGLDEGEEGGNAREVAQMRTRVMLGVPRRRGEKAQEVRETRGERDQKSVAGL
jgi:hypothetical protein